MGGDEAVNRWEGADVSHCAENGGNVGVILCVCPLAVVWVKIQSCEEVKVRGYNTLETLHTNNVRWCKKDVFVDFRVQHIRQVTI